MSIFFFRLTSLLHLRLHSSEPGARLFFDVTSIYPHSLQILSSHPPSNIQIIKMKSFSVVVATFFALATTVLAVPPFDPAGVPHVGNGVGQQFITGQCLSDADCASGCCANPTGICSGPGAATQQGKTGCGFVSGAPVAAAAPPPAPAPAPVAAAATAGGPAFDPAGDKNVGNGKGVQFIGGQCLSAADCASGCCAGPSGICSGVGAQTQAGKTGCGFVSKRSLHLPGRRSHVMQDSDLDSLN